MCEVTRQETEALDEEAAQARAANEVSAPPSQAHHGNTRTFRPPSLTSLLWWRYVQWWALAPVLARLLS